MLSVLQNAYVHLEGNGTLGGSLLLGDNAVVDLSLPFDAADNAALPVYSLNQLTVVGNGFLQLNATVTVIGTNTLTNVELGGGILQGTGTFIVAHELDWFGGNMMDAGTTVINGGATLLIDSADINIHNRKLTNNGTIDWVSDNTIGTSLGAIVNNGLFKIEGDGSLTGNITITNNGILQNEGFATLQGAFTNSGIINDLGGQLTLQGARFDNPGSVSIGNATLLITANGQSSGIFLGTSAQGQLEFRPQTSYTLTAASHVSMAGSVGFTNGNVVVSGSYSAISTVISNASVRFDNDVTLLNGFLGGANGRLTGPNGKTVTITGQFVWQQGTMDGGGITLITPTGTLSLNNTDATVAMPDLGLAPDSKFLGSADSSRKLVNQGTISWLGGDLTIQRGSTLTNSAAFYLYGNNTLTVYGSFTNAGTLTKDFQPLPRADAPDAFLYVFNQSSQGNEGASTITSIANNGVINVKTGQLILNAGNSPGSINVSPMAEVHFSSGIFTVSPSINPALLGLQLSGNGTYYIDGGTLRLDVKANVANLQLNSGTLTGSGTLTITHEMVWSSGLMSGMGTTYIGDPTLLYTRENAPLLYMAQGNPELARLLFIPGLVIWMNPNGITRRQTPVFTQGVDNGAGVVDVRRAPIETFKMPAGALPNAANDAGQAWTEYQGLLGAQSSQMQASEQNAYQAYQQGMVNVSATFQNGLASAKTAYQNTLSNWRDLTAPGALDAVLQAEETREQSVSQVTNDYVNGERTLYAQYIQALSAARNGYYGYLSGLLHQYQQALRDNPSVAYWGLADPDLAAEQVRLLLMARSATLERFLRLLGPESRAALAESYERLFNVELSAYIATRLGTLWTNEVRDRVLNLFRQDTTADPLPAAPLQSISTWVQNSVSWVSSLTLGDVDRALLNAQQSLNDTAQRLGETAERIVRDGVQQVLNDPVGVGLAVGGVFLNTHAVALNTYTFGLIPVLDRHVAQVIQENQYYRVIQIGSMIGREIAIQAALGALTGGVGNVIVTAAARGSTAARLAANTICFVTSVQRVLAPVQLASQMYSFGVGANRAYNSLNGGDFWTGAEQLTQSAMQLPGLWNSLRQTAQLFNAAQQGRQALGALLRACFAAGTPIMWEFGYKNIEEFKPGERVWARDENDINAPLVLREIEECFVRTARIWHLHVGGQVIRTTGEHPFWVYGCGWVEANLLKPGDRLCSHDGRWIAVEEIYDTGEYETVYNFSVAEDHTYFVANQEWNFGVWAHNVRVCGTSPQARANYQRIFRRGRRSGTGATTSSPGPNWNQPWTPPTNWRGPREGIGRGHWEGVRGNSNWISERPAVIAIVGRNPQTGQANPIIFYQGRVNFSRWSQGQLTVPGLRGRQGRTGNGSSGTSPDNELIYEAIVRQYNLGNVAQLSKREIQNRATAWLRTQPDGYGGTGLRPHHAGGDIIELIPSRLHDAVSHTNVDFVH